MAHVITVSGPVPPESLGPVLLHEHLAFCEMSMKPPQPSARLPNFRYVHTAQCIDLREREKADIQAAALMPRRVPRPDPSRILGGFAASRVDRSGSTHPARRSDRMTAPRLVTVTDIDDFARLTGDHHPLHTDDAFARSMGFRSRIAHGLLGLSLMEGIKTGLRLYVHSIASLGWNAVRFVQPLFTATAFMHVEIRFTAKRLSRHADRGVVTEAVSLLDQAGATLTEAEHVTLLLRRHAVPLPKQPRQDRGDLRHQDERQNVQRQD